MAALHRRTAPSLRLASGQTFHNSGIDDLQVSRLFYIAKKVLMSRKKYATIPLNVVNEAAVDTPINGIQSSFWTSGKSVPYWEQTFYFVWF